MLKNIIIVTGLAGSGKTTRAQELACMATSNGQKATVLALDNYRYSDDKWTKAPANVFKDKVFEALGKCNEDELVFIDTAYHDAHDSENAREWVVGQIINTGRVNKVIVFIPSQIGQTAALIDRCIGRATGKIPQGTCPETSESRAKLLIKNIECYKENVQRLSDFLKHCRDIGIPTETSVGMCHQ